MFEPALDALARVTEYADPLVWLAMTVFVAGAALERGTERRDWARSVTVAAWVVFAAFWFSQIYYFVFVHKSIVEGLGAMIAVPASLYVGYLLLGGRDSLFVLSRAIAVMGLIYLPFESSVLLRGILIETVTRQTEFLMTLLGFEPTVVNSAEIASQDYDPVRGTFEFYPDAAHTDDGRHRVVYTIILACTGIGSMAIFGGLIAAVDAPLRRKLRAVAVSIPVIYGLNLARNVFIGLSFGHQYAHVFPETVMAVFGTTDPYMVSFFVADRIVAQGLAVVALVGITWLVVRELPEVTVVVEDLLFVVTGREYELQDALAPSDRPVAADGGSQSGSESEPES